MPKDAVFTQNQSPVVGIGAKVLIEVNGEQQEWEIVDVGQTDIPKGKISYQAPLIKAILGAKEEDMISCKMTDSNVKIRVRRVSLVSLA